jgi:hypothetical protein
MADQDIIEELSRYDRDYAPQAGRRPGIDTLADGDYDFSIQGAILDRTEKNREPILKLELKAAPGGNVIEHVYFFRTQDAIDRLGADLCTLGFDADQWTAQNGRRFSAELPAAVARLTGVRFRGHKTAVQKDGKTFHNLYVNARLAGTPMPGTAPLPRTPRPAPQPAIPTGPAQRAWENAAAGNDSDIPF